MVSSIHVSEHLGRGHIGAERARPGLHHVANAARRGTLELGLEHAAEYHALFVDDDARLPCARGATGDVHRVVEAAGGHVCPGDVFEVYEARGGSLKGQPVRAPVSLPGGVLVDLAEAEAFEPPRGPWAEVSLEIVAIDDDRVVLTER